MWLYLTISPSSFICYKEPFDGWWGNVVDHIKQNDGAVAAGYLQTTTHIMRKLRCGVVDGGFVDNSIPRYNKSDNYDLYGLLP